MEGHDYLSTDILLNRTTRRRSFEEPAVEDMLQKDDQCIQMALDSVSVFNYGKYRNYLNLTVFFIIKKTAFKSKAT